MSETSRPTALMELTTYLLSQTARVAKRHLDDELSAVLQSDTERNERVA